VKPLQPLRVIDYIGQNGLNGDIKKYNKYIIFKPPSRTPKHDSFDLSDMSTKQARALFDYDAVTSQELSVRKDDVGQ
jgi:hypothetical protein